MEGGDNNSALCLLYKQSVPHTNLRPRVKQQPRHLDMPVHACFHQRGVHLVGLVLPISAGC